MRGLIVVVSAFLMMAGGLLIALAPDTLSIVVVILMCGAIALGFFLGMLPTILYALAFKNARLSITETLSVQSAENWIAVFKVDNFFRNKNLDKVFNDYKNKIEAQKENDEIASDIEDYISEDMLYVLTWQGLVLQIPGTLTGLGILGTFFGLITGISSIGFSSMEAAIESITILLNGIELAFYTSIAGVILSIIFNIINRTAWNIMLREHVFFIDIFHKEVIPTVEEQSRIKNQSNMKKIISRLDRIPKEGGFSLSSPNHTNVSTAKEQALMPQILEGMKKGEFVFFLQPKVEFSSRKICSAEALVRWNHASLGIISPSVFMPLIEQNGYIVKMDALIWEQVCKKIREWIDAGKRPVPISINISKTDVLAMDIVGFFENMLTRYKIPPRALDLEIAKSAYVQNPDITKEVAGSLRRMGFKIIMDNFDGDFISVNMFENTEVDEINLNLKFIQENFESSVAEIFEKSRKLKLEMTAGCVENTEQLSVLNRNGCRTGQGYYFFSPMNTDEFEEALGQD